MLQIMSLAARNCLSVFLTTACVVLCRQVHVLDLAADTNAPLCVQKVVRKAHLTRLAFNPTQPVLVVGDDRQVVAMCLGHTGAAASSACPRQPHASACA